MRTFLASDIAKRVRRGDEDPVRVLNRVRNWTKLGLLEPAGDAHPGGGRPCVYSEGALLDAMLLQELVDAGVDAVRAAPILEQIKRDAPNLFIASLTKLSNKTLLVIGKEYSNSKVLNISLRSPDSLAKLASMHALSFFYIIDIERLRDRLNAEPDGEGE